MKTTALAATGMVAILLAGPVAAAEDGAALYASQCAMCHGDNGVAKKMAEPSANLNDPKWQEANPVEAIAKVISEGKGKMVGYKDKLTPEQIKAIAAHVKTLK
ncbi:MAG: c-type cytochrome [Candidatus Polarisedimenticolia bacterium]